MKFYAVNGSPRKSGYTATLLDHALEGIKSVVLEADCERIDLYDHTCSRSHFSRSACKRIGGKSFGKCAKKDEITEAIEKLSEADGIIFGSPVYFHDITAQLSGASGAAALLLISHIRKSMILWHQSGCQRRFCTR